MNILLAQLQISKDINVNIKKVLEVLEKSKSNQWVIFPEGMLSGYYPEEATFIDSLNYDLLDLAYKEIKAQVTKKNNICIVGSITKKDDKVFNSTCVINKNSSEFYDKCNLSTLDRNHFNAGLSLKTFSYDNIPFGVQMCRENAFPEQWVFLKDRGVKVVFHINNAVAKYDGKRKHLLISRAMENQIFVVSVNAVTDTSPLASMVIGPYGDVLYEAPLHKEIIHEIEVDISKIRNDYQHQKRNDLVKVVGKG